MPESRPLDYIYDGTNTVGSLVDHNSQLRHAVTYDVVSIPSSPLIFQQIQPVYLNMFSKLAHFPSLTLKYCPNAVPVMANSLPINPPALIHHTPTALVQGSNKFKYFTKPMVPFINENAVYARAETPAVAAIKPESVNAYSHRSVYVQTMYRESHAQTDPYSPDYVLHPRFLGPNVTVFPEVLTLTALKFGNGLPASVREIEIIERARVKRIWEASMPAGTDEISLERRLKMMEQMELSEWKEREIEIAQVQEARLAILQKIIRKRRSENESLNKERVEKLLGKKVREKDAFMMKLLKKKEKEMRRLDFYRSAEGRNQPMDIVERCAMKSKQKCAKESLSMQEQLLLENLYSGEGDLDKLVDKYSSQVNSTEANYELPDTSLESNQNSRKVLDRIWSKLGVSSVGELEEVSRFETKLTKALVRATTPIISLISLSTMNMHKAAICIQQTLRGKLVEAEMQSGVDKRRDLIEEVRCKYALANDKSTSPQNEKHQTFYESAIIIPSDTRVESVIESAYLGKMFDHYTKELSRLREEKKIMAMVILTERIRKQKESFEVGRRQGELAKREFEERAFREVLGVHNSTVGTFLESIIRDEVGSTSTTRATESVIEYAARLNEFLICRYMSEPELMYGTVSELVLQFLIPEVERQSVQRQLDIQESAYLVAIRDVIKVGGGSRQQSASVAKTMSEIVSQTQEPVLEVKSRRESSAQI